MIALTAALGGGAFAIANSDTKQDKKIATKVVKKLAPRLSVKHAASANTAATATNASHASTADNATSLGGVAASGYRVETAVASSNSLPGFQSSSDTAVDIPGASASVNVPTGQNGILVVTFSAVSLCTNATAGFNCPVQILVDGAPANPTPDSSGYIFDTTVLAGNSKNRALSLTASKPVSAGDHTVKVAFGGAVPVTTFTLRTWHLLVQSFPG
jgi:hypothetical protein